MSRRPASFRLDRPAAPAGRAAAAPSKRAPRAVHPRQAAGLVMDEADHFAAENPIEDRMPATAPPRRGRSWATRLLISALGILLSLAVGLWVDGLVRDLFSRADWLGWLALTLAACALFALAAIVAREVLALLRLASIEAIRRRGSEAAARNDTRAARQCVKALCDLLAAKPQTAAGRARLGGFDAEVIDGADLIALAERQLLAPLDAMARRQVLDAAKRVSVVTAVSPRALLDVAYVLFEAVRLTRRIADIYGGRPGVLGFMRLVRAILAHLAVTGSLAAGETLVQQIVGQGLAARLSARLGEGIVNGMMTARIGVAAMEAARPLAFAALPRPGIGDFLKALTRPTAGQMPEQTPGRTPPEGSGPGSS